MGACCCPLKEYAPQLTQRASLKSSKQRQCTDCCCFLIFFLSVGVMVLIQIAAATLGDPNQLLHGTDYTGAACGVGRMAAKPFAHYPRLGEDLGSQRHKFTTAPWNIHLYGLCVEACPVQDEDVLDYICEEDSSACKWNRNPLLPSWGFGSDEPNLWHTAVRTTSLMGRCMPLAVKQTQEVELCAFPDCKAAGKECFTLLYPKEHYWLPRSEVERGQCERLVELSTARVSESPSSSIESEYIGAFFGGISGTMEQLSLALAEIIAIGVVFAVLCNFVLLRVLRSCMAVAFVLTIVAVLLLLGFANVFLFSRAGMLDVSGATSSALGALHHISHTLNITQVIAAVDTAAGGVEAQVASHAELFAAVAEGDLENYTMAAWACLGLTLAIVLVLGLVASKLKNALAICAMATKPIAAMPALLLLPALSVLLSAVVVVNFFFTLFMFLTPDPETTSSWLLLFTSNVTNTLIQGTGDNVGHLAQDNSEVQRFGRAIETLAVQLDELPVDAHKLVYAAAGFEAFSGLWLLCLIEAVTYTTISGAVGYWYFTGSQDDRDLADLDDRTRFPVLSSLYRCVRFHLGTMAAGSFILATLTVARAALAYLDAKTKDLQGGSSLLKCALKCAQCCLWVFHRIVKFLTKFAFVAVATDGQPFCTAAFASFRLTTDHPLQMLANEAAMAVLSLLQLILTPLLCALLAYNAVAWQWRTNLLEAWGAINAWGDAVCGQYQSDTVDACGYKATVLGFLSSTTTLTDWPADEKPNELRVAVATLLVSFWVTRTFRSVYAAAVDTIFVCCVRSEDEEDARPYKKPEMAETVLQGSSRNLISGGLISA